MKTIDKFKIALIALLFLGIVVVAFWAGSSYSNAKEQMMKQEGVFYVETIEALPGKTEELKKALLAAIPKARKEKGIVSFDLSQDCERPELFVVLIKFKNLKAYDEHLAADYIQDFMKKYDGNLYGNVVEEFYQRVKGPE